MWKWPFWPKKDVKIFRISTMSAFQCRSNYTWVLLCHFAVWVLVEFNINCIDVYAVLQCVNDTKRICYQTQSQHVKWTFNLLCSIMHRFKADRPKLKFMTSHECDEIENDPRKAKRSSNRSSFYAIGYYFGHSWGSIDQIGTNVYIVLIKLSLY